MTYLAVVKVENNRIAKYQEFESQSDADAHVAVYGGFVAQEPDAGHMYYWVVDEGAKTITHDSSTETADKAAYDAQAYARSRKEEYPTIEECVHAILDGELDDLQIKRQAVKNKYPKEI